MKTIIAGGRNITDYNLIIEAVQEANFEITEIVSGGAKGVDALGEKYATEHNINLKIFPANWEKYKRAAGPIRNKQMAEYADALIAVWDGQSRGTKNMIEQAADHHLKVYVKKI